MSQHDDANDGERLVMSEVELNRLRIEPEKLRLELRDKEKLADKYRVERDKLTAELEALKEQLETVWADRRTLDDANLSLNQQLAELKEDVDGRRAIMEKVLTEQARAIIKEQKAQIDELRKQVDDMNKNCISLFLHESRMKELEERIDELKAEGRCVSETLQEMMNVGAAQIKSLTEANKILSEAISSARGKLDFFMQFRDCNIDGEANEISMDLSQAIAEAKKAMGE